MHFMFEPRRLLSTIRQATKGYQISPQIKKVFKNDKIREAFMTDLSPAFIGLEFNEILATENTALLKDLNLLPLVFRLKDYS